MIGASPFKRGSLHDLASSPDARQDFDRVGAQGKGESVWLAQFLADILGITVQRPRQTETTALGAAYLAGLQSGIYDSFDELSNNWQQEAEFAPTLETGARDALIAGWIDAIGRVRSR